MRSCWGGELLLTNGASYCSYPSFLVDIPYCLDVYVMCVFAHYERIKGLEPSPLLAPLMKKEAL